MATHAGGNEIIVHQENDNNAMDNTVDNMGTTGDANIATGPATGGTGAAGGGPGTTNFNLRVEQNKILEFFGTKSKDTISAMDFIR
jgi:hypothetical protein